MKTLLSLFDFTGEWSRPYAEAGYHVVTVDIKDISPLVCHPNRRHIAIPIEQLGAGWASTLTNVRGVLLATPCTHFALTGAKHFKAKDADGRTEEAVQLVRAALKLKDCFPDAWWALENPASRIHKLVPELGQPTLKFHPYQYGGYVDPPDIHRKLTWLWGNFKLPLPRPVEPLPRTAKGFDPWYNKVGGKSEKTKEYRSATPRGFARAFFEANP